MPAARPTLLFVPDDPGMRPTVVPPPVVAALAAASMYACSDRRAGSSDSAASAALLLGAIGMLLMLAAAATLLRRHTTLDPMRPARASRLVTQGPFRWSRNPIYLADTLLLAAWALWLGSLVAAIGPLLFVAWIDRLQIPAEEQALTQRFGAAYLDYCRRVRRWL